MSRRSLKIYKPEDIEGLLNIDALNSKTKNESERLIQEAKIKCENLEKETYDNVMKKFHAEQLELFEKSFVKVNDFFKKSENELLSILKTVFSKMKLEEKSIEIMSNLIFDEVEKLKIKSQKFNIYANHKVIPLLQENIRNQFKLSESIYFDYDIKNDLSSHECLLESDYIMVRITIDDFHEKILQMFSGL
jgi:hypothetical protein